MSSGSPADVLHRTNGNRPSAGKDPNRRAPRDFASAPKGHAMSEGSPDIPKPKTDSAAGDAKGAAKPKSSMGGMGRGGMRNRAPLRLLAALRGSGWLVWSGGAIPAAYELDLFASGPMHMANGNLEGDFSSLPAPAETGDSTVGPARVRLDDGREFAVDLVVVEDAWVEFEAPDAPELAKIGADAHPSPKKA
jgi:hypothetical protein